MVGGPQQNSRAHQNLVAASLTSGLITAQDGNIQRRKNFKLIQYRRTNLTLPHHNLARRTDGELRLWKRAYQRRSPISLNSEMESWGYFASDWKAQVVLACITCENVVLLTTKPEILRKKAQTTNLFLPTVCLSCENNERMAGTGSATPLWTSLCISHNIIRTWQPFLEIRAFLEGELFTPTTKVKLAQRDEVRDKVGSEYITSIPACRKNFMLWGS
jgi:hypothetical protein